MRLLLLLCSGIFAVSSLLSQPIGDYELAIEERLAAYQYLARQERFEEMLDYVYAPLFELVAPADLTERFRYNAHHPDLDLVLGHRYATYFGSPLESGFNTYVELGFYQDLHVSFKPEAKGDVDFIEATISMFSNEFGAENLVYDELHQSMVIRIPKKLLAIRTEADLQWYFLEINAATLPFVGSILPRGIARSLK